MRVRATRLERTKTVGSRKDSLSEQIDGPADQTARSFGTSPLSLLLAGMHAGVATHQELARIFEWHCPPHKQRPRRRRSTRPPRPHACPMALETIAGWILPTSRTLPEYVSIRMPSTTILRTACLVAALAFYIGYDTYWAGKESRVIAVIDVILQAYGAVPATLLRLQKPPSWLVQIMVHVMAYPMIAEGIAYIICFMLPHIHRRYPTLAARVALSAAPIRVARNVCASFILITVFPAIWHIWNVVMVAHPGLRVADPSGARSFGEVIVLWVLVDFLVLGDECLIPWRPPPPPIAALPPPPQPQETRRPRTRV